MQLREYNRYTRTYADAKQLCVGMFDRHEKYPYEKYLLERYDQRRDRALDFACGMGRMINRMLRCFDHVDGVDLNAANLDYAVQYLSGNNWPPDKYRLYQSNGTGINLTAGDYSFIYSTIALQHIAVYTIRRKILEDIYRLLRAGGQSCLQMGFGWNNGVHWFDNCYTARSTNAGCDVTIPDRSHLPAIEADLKSIGFKQVRFELKESPHSEYNDRYHSQWIFIHLWK